MDLKIAAEVAGKIFAVIGGMISSILLKLVVVPAVYSLVEERLARRWGALQYESQSEG
jgi:Cu/Ag efflux pump CusA